MGQLGAAVDAGRFVRVRLDDDRIAPLGSGDVDDVGQVIFARRIVVADLVEPAEQVLGPGCHHAAVAKADGTFFLGRVLVLDHLGDVVALAEDDAPVLERIGRRGSEHHDARPAVTVQAIEHALQRLRLDERRIAVKDEDRALISRQGILRLLDGVGSTLLLRLMCDAHLAAVERLLDLIAALADDDDAFLGTKARDAVEQVHQQALARDRVQDLVRVRAHAGALPRRKDHDCEIGSVAHSGASNGTLAGTGQVPLPKKVDRLELPAILDVPEGPAIA